jgi:hypothetical protein
MLGLAFSASFANCCEVQVIGEKPCSIVISPSGLQCQIIVGVLPSSRGVFAARFFRVCSVSVLKPPLCLNSPCCTTHSSAHARPISSLVSNWLWSMSAGILSDGSMFFVAQAVIASRGSAASFGRKFDIIACVRGFYLLTVQLPALEGNYPTGELLLSRSRILCTVSHELRFLLCFYNYIKNL